MDNPAHSARRLQRLFGLAACVLVGLFYLDLRYGSIRHLEFYFRSDMSTHFMNGVDVADRLAAHDWQGLRDVIKAQTYWPFLQSVLLGLFMFVGGVDPKVAILCTNVVALGCGILLYLIGSSLETRGGSINGWFALANLLTAPLFITRACSTKLEIYVLFFVLLTIRLFFFAMDSRRPAAFLLTGASLTGLFFTRYEYGVITLFCVGVALLTDHALRLRGTVSHAAGGDSPARAPIDTAARELKQLATSLSLVLLPLVAALWWWASLGDEVERLGSIWQALTWRHASGAFGELRFTEPGRARGFVLDVRQAFQAYDGLFYANVGLCCITLLRWRAGGRKVAFLVLLLLVSSYTVLIHPLREARFSVPFFPIFWLLSGYGLAQILGTIDRARVRNGLAAASILVVVVVATAPAHDFQHSRRVRVPFSLADSSHPRDLLQLAGSLLERGADVTIVGGLEDSFSPDLIRWELGRKRGEQLRMRIDSSTNVVRLERTHTDRSPPELAYVIAVRQLGRRTEKTSPGVRAAIERMVAQSECFRLDAGVQMDRREITVFQVVKAGCTAIEWSG